MPNEGYVYRISAPGSNSVYVGQTVNPKMRFWRHQSLARQGKASNPALYRFLKKHPDAVFYSWPVFDMNAEEIAEERLCRDMGFNLLNCAPCGGPSIRGWKHTTEARAKMTGLKRSPETCDKIRTAMTGQEKSPETLLKMSASHTGRRHSVEARNKMSASSKGRKKSSEHRANMSRARRGVPWSEKRRATYEARRGNHAAD